MSLVWEVQGTLVRKWRGNRKERGQPGKGMALYHLPQRATEASSWGIAGEVVQNSSIQISPWEA